MAREGEQCTIILITELERFLVVIGFLCVFLCVFFLICKSVKDVEGGADFANAETLRKVHYLIQSMDKDLPRELSM